MTKPHVLFEFKIQSVTNKKQNKKKPPTFLFTPPCSGRSPQTLHEDRGCPYHFCTPWFFQSDQ